MDLQDIYIYDKEIKTLHVICGQCAIARNGLTSGEDIGEDTCCDCVSDAEGKDAKCTRSSTAGDDSLSYPWEAPGISLCNFLGVISFRIKE